MGYDTIRCWTIEFGTLIAKRLNRRHFVGIWMKWSVRAAESACAFGGPSMTRTTAAEVQIPSRIAEIPHHPRSDLHAFNIQHHLISRPAL
ncbi:hypothetical protein [Brevundimonas sp. NIBR10]|uniref:hypothetical protein n=1 Tax=Brevundimonas sp. NIBR10 TaxID=3015997 RepID=UPI0022F15B56|nr:hypothetical protein [Brevundimonas sp. NIBR10]